MSTLIIALHNILCMIKDFNAGYTSSCTDKMVIKYKDRLYQMQLTELDPIEVTDSIRDDYKIYDDDDVIIMSDALQKLSKIK